MKIVNDMRGNKLIIGFILVLFTCTCQRLEQDLTHQEWKEIVSSLSDETVRFVISDELTTKAADADGSYVLLASQIGGLKNLSVMTEDNRNDVVTRADVTSLSSFKCTMTKGAIESSQTNVWNNITFSQVGSTSVYEGSQVWPATDQSFRFNASNRDITFNSAGCTVTTTTSIDCICAYMSSPTFQGSNTLTFEHVLAKMGTLTVTPDTGLDIRNVTVSMKPKMGTYNMRTKAWTSTSEGSATTVYTVSTAAAAGTTVSPASDIYTVPGSYTLTFAWDVYSGGSLSNSYSSETCDITLPVGKISNLSVTISESRVIYSFGGLEIAPGNLYYDGSSWSIDETWDQHCTYNTAYGVTSGTPSSYFRFLEMGQLFEKANFNTSDGDIENLLNPLDGWRMPTNPEFSTIFTNSSAKRAGSTVNGSANMHYAFIQLSRSNYAGNGKQQGALLFPDGMTITGKTLSGTDNSTLTTNVTISQLNNYLSQGCIFMPNTGSNTVSTWRSTDCYYLSSTSGRARYIYDYGIATSMFSASSSYYCCVRLVKPI